MHRIAIIVWSISRKNAISCSQVNQIHNNVKFTYELENNKQLPFLDANVDNSKKN